MKFLLAAGLTIITILQGFGQLDNSEFTHENNFNAADSGRLFLGLQTLGFTKNNEYFNDIADGYTLFGYQLNPYLTYYATPDFRISAGVYLQKDFGNDDYSEIAPTFTAEYKHGDASVIFGNIQGSVSHQLIEPLYDFERVLINRQEHGLQFLLDRDGLFLDMWVEWRNMIYKGDNDQEEVLGGLSLNKTILAKDNFTLTLPVQFLVYHKGGQIDSSPAPLQTYTNSAVGGILRKNFSSGLVQSLELSGYHVYFKDFSGTRLRVYEDGSGMYFNALIETKKNLGVMLSYWRGHEFISIVGGQLYPSVSSAFKTPDNIEEIRELLIFRLMHTMKISDEISLTSRFEPFYDLQNGQFEFSHGFYIRYTPQFFIAKIKNQR